MDKVTCTSCDWEGLVDCGEEYCPACESYGTLRWTHPDDHDQWEVEE